MDAREFGDLYRDWLEEYLRIVNGQLQVRMAEIAATKSLLDMQGLAAFPRKLKVWYRQGNTESA